MVPARAEDVAALYLFLYICNFDVTQPGPVKMKHEQLVEQCHTTNLDIGLILASQRAQDTM